jgi:hypothetical protein
MEVADTFGFLLGAWRVSRSIEDRQAGISGSFEGSALLVIPLEWQARGVWARYDETGTLQFGGHRGPASRTLGYMRRHDGTVAAVAAVWKLVRASAGWSAAAGAARLPLWAA